MSVSEQSVSKQSVFEDVDQSRDSPMSWLVVLIAAGVWLITAMELLVINIIGPRSMWVCIVMIVVVVVAGARVMSRRRSRRRLIVHVIAGVCGVGVICAAVVTWRVLPLQRDQLVVDTWRSASSGHLRIEADVVINSAPEHRSGRTSGSRLMSDSWRSRATVLMWRRIGLASMATNLPAQLDFARPVNDVQPGALVHVVGSVRPGDPLQGTAVYLRAEAIHVIHPAPMWQRLAAVFRQSVTAAVRTHPADVRGLLPGLVVGQTNDMPDDLAMAMRDSGLSHLSAVSGGNISIVIVVWLTALRSAGLRRGRWQLCAVALGVLVYVVVVQPQPSVDRAALMAMAALGAHAIGLRLRAEAVLAATVSVLVIVDPFLSISPGFAMSVLATAALIVVARKQRPPVQATRAGAWVVLTRILTVTATLATAAVAATVIVAPVSVWFGNGMQLGGIVANILAEPCVFPATAFGLIAGLVGLVSPAVAAIVVTPGCWATDVIAHIARWTATNIPPMPWVSGLQGAGIMLALVVGGIGALVIAPGGTIRRLCMAVMGIGLVLCLGVPTPVAQPLASSTSWPPAGWRIIMCDVGQGDSMLIRIDDVTAIVVDTGPDPAFEQRCIQRAGIAHVPVVVLTHFHADHVEGLPGLLAVTQPGLLEVSPLAEPVAEARRVKRWAAAAGSAIHLAAPADVVHVGPVAMTVVWPQRILRGLGSDPNNASVTMVASVDGIRVLLGGDLETAAQQAVLASGQIAAVDVVKVPHHGSAKQSPDWARVTRPRFALIGVGVDNDYGHPWPGTVRQYQAVGATIGRTDVDGDLAIVKSSAGVLQLIRRGRWG